MDAAVSSATQGEAVIINLLGTCSEDVTIKGNDLTLRTKPGQSRARIKGTVTVDAAARFYITDLRFTGSSYGIEVTNGSTGTIESVRVYENKRSGIRISSGANVTITDSEITENGRGFPAPDAGIEVLDSASVYSSGNSVTKNAFAAVSVTSHGVFRNGLRADPDDDQKDKDRDIYLQLGCQDGASPGCGSADDAAIFLDIAGLAEIHNARTTGNIMFRGTSSLVMTTGRMFGDVRGAGNAGASISRTVTGEGRLSCSSNAFSFGDDTYNCGSLFIAPN